MSTSALPRPATMPYHLGALLQFHFGEDVVLATAEDTHQGTALTVRILAEWNDGDPGINLDTRGDEFTIFPDQLTDGSTAIRVVQPQDVTR